MTVISVYTRAQAIEDRVLIDVSKPAKEVGFRVPVALTGAAWVEAVAVHCEDFGQDETGRLWDVLSVLRYEARSARKASVVFFDVLVSRGGNPPTPVHLKAHIGPGDQGEPVMTVMLPHQD